MKQSTLKTAALAAAFASSMVLGSCKGEGKAENAPDTISNTKDTIPEEGMSSRPMADTLVDKNGDTLISTDTKAPNQNPTGEQVP